jgi:hypothetical protein
MNDTPPFSPFATQPPPAPMFDSANAEQAPKTRKGRKPKAAKQAKAPRKKREPKLAAVRIETSSEPTKPTKRKARTTRAPTIGLSAMMAFIGLTEEDFKLTMQLAEALQGVPKKSRARIVTALGKVFA